MAVLHLTIDEGTALYHCINKRIRQLKDKIKALNDDLYKYEYCQSELERTMCQLLSVESEHKTLSDVYKFMTYKSTNEVEATPRQLYITRLVIQEDIKLFRDLLGGTDEEREKVLFTELQDKISLYESIYNNINTLIQKK